jgi:hypothetical protein
LGGIQGELITAEDSQLAAGLFLERIDYITDPKKILVQIRSVVDADYNNNGRADAADFVLWRKTFGAAVARGTGADGNHSGIVDAEDYNLWRSQFGATSGSGAGSGAAPIPEPATISLVLTTVLLLKSRRSTRRQGENPRKNSCSASFHSSICWLA